MMRMRKVLAVLFSLAAGPAFAQGTPAGNSGDFQTNAGRLRFGSTTPGTGVASAFQNPINAASGFVTYSGAFGTPTSLNLTNATALPSTSLTGTLQAGQFPALTGDITTSAGALATTLATVNGNVGSFGSSTSCPAFTVNAKGLITAASASTCAPAIGSITGLGTGVATALGVAVGSAGAPVINGGALGTPSSGNGTNLTGLVYTALPALSANQILGALTATTPSGQSVPSCSAANNALIWTSGTGFGCNTISAGAISSVSNSDGTLTISPTTGAVVASIALGHANTWTNVQTFNSGDLSATAPAFSGTFTGTYTLGGTPSIPASGLTGTALPAAIVTSSLTSLGTIATGTWNGTAVGAQWGGTGQNFSASTGVIQASSGTFSATTTPTLTATNVTGLPGHQISLSRLCTSTTGSSSSTSYACSTSPTFTPVSGDVIHWQPGANDLPNTGIAPTLAVNGGSAIVIKKNAAAQPLNPADVGSVKSTSQYELVYDGTNWQLMSQMANDISTYNNAANNALSAFYACLANADTGVCRIVDNADSEHTCWLPSTCAFGPQHEQNLPMVAFMTLLQRRGYPLYSTGIIGPISVVSTASLFSNGIMPGITCTGTVAQVSLSGVGPQQATGALTGGGTLQMASGAVCTVAVSTFAYNGNAAGAFNRFRVYCAINSTTGNMTVTISGQTASTACTGTNASPLAQAFTVTNSAGTTALTVAITCTTGTCNLGGYEEIYTTANNGIAIDAFEATGGANSNWLGAAAGNAAYLKLATGTVGLVIQSIGINDAAGSIAASTVTANMATFAANWPAASELIWSSFPYTGTGSTNYPAIQQAEQTYALTNFYDFLNTVDNGSSNTSINYWNGCQNSDTTHPTDMCASSNFAQLWIHLIGSESQAAVTYGAILPSNNNGYVSELNSTDTSVMFNTAICYVSGLTYCGYDRIISAPNATFQTMWSRGIAATTQTASNGAVAPLGSLTFGYSNTAGTLVPAAAQFSWINDPTTGLVYEPFNRVPLTTAFSMASVTPQSITGWSWAILSGQTMIIDCDGMYQAASTGGLRFQTTGPTMTAFQQVHMMGLNSTAASMASPPAITTIGSLTTAVAVTTATTNYAFHLHIYANASAGGTLHIPGASAAAVNLTIGVGSTCVVH